MKSYTDCMILNKIRIVKEALELDWSRDFDDEAAVRAHYRWLELELKLLEDMLKAIQEYERTFPHDDDGLDTYVPSK